MRKGGIAVQTENIFPVIKKWLYSDKDIFLRELVSNACDAITKHKRLVSLAEADESVEAYTISVVVNKALKTLTVKDNGIGMTEEELDKYINNMALSGALDFISKYEGEDSKGGGIIGHFGLGFYSAFMVADTVEIITKSYTDSAPVHWECKENGEFEMSAADMMGRGSSICLHISDDNLEYLDYVKVKSILDKYCSFMPCEVYCIEGDKKELVNSTVAVWQKNANDVSEEEYNGFYKKMFSDYRDPIFSVHLNADYPLNFKGVLYFPPYKSNFESKEGVIKLFYNSVFVADNIKEIVPDYLSFLCGALDCPELPLNVSRSYLQDNAYIRKLSAHIVKKIADKLCRLKNDDLEKYSELWDVIRPYIEYGCIKDEKFYDRVKSAVLLKDTNGNYFSISELADKSEETKLYYTTDPIKQSYYVKLFNDKNVSVYVLDTVVDAQFITFAEQKCDKIKFMRVDASLDEFGDAADDNAGLKELFSEVTGKVEDKISFASLGEDGAIALIRVNEESRRFSDMMKMYMPDNAGDGMPSTEEELVLNAQNGVVTKLLQLDKEKAVILAKHIYYTAAIAGRQLSKEEQADFFDNNKKLCAAF